MNIMQIIKKTIWIIKGKPMLNYIGEWCGMCGKYEWKYYQIPEYQSCGMWWDAWGACEECCK